LVSKVNSLNSWQKTTEILIATDHTEKKLINISVVSVAISTSVVKIVTHNLAEKPELDCNLRELNLLDFVALLRSNTEF